MPKVNINGVNIYYEVHGQGESLVLLHHGIGCTKMWGEVLPGFAASYKVILYDRRGFGRSDKGENFRDYYLSEQYNQNSVTELSSLLKYLDIKDKIYVIGQCEGGAVAFHYTAQNPDRVKAIAISSTLCYSKVTVSECIAGKIFSSFEEADSEFQGKLVYWHGETYARELYSLFLEMGGPMAPGYLT